MCGGKGGGGGKPQVAGTQVVEQRSEFPDEIKPFITDILEKAQARFNQQTGQPMPIYPGGVEGRIAPMESEQVEALEGYRQAGRSGLAGAGLSSARPYYEAGLSALGESMKGYGPQQAQQYMNPYQQAVVDVAKREAIRQAQPTFRSIGDRAESTGAFGGSRQAIAEAEANRNLQQQLGDIQTRGMQSAFEQGRAAFEQQKAREAAGAGRLFGQAPLAYRQGLSELAALEGVGKTTRAEDQRKKNLLYEQFQQEQMYPTKALSEYQSIVRGFPYQPSMYRTEQNLAPSPGLGQQLMGGLGAAGSIYGAMGGFGKGGFGNVFGQTGGQVGGLASLASGGQIQGGGFETHQNNILAPQAGWMRNLSQIGKPMVEEETDEMTIIQTKLKNNQPLTIEEEIKLQSVSESQVPGLGPDIGDKGLIAAQKEAEEREALEPFGGKGLSSEVTKGLAKDEKGLTSLVGGKKTGPRQLTPAEIVSKKAQTLIPNLITPEIQRDTEVLQNLRKSIASRTPESMIDQEVKGIGKITTNYQNALDALIDDGKKHTADQTKRWGEYQKGRETYLDKRHKRQMGDLLARGKKAKDRGERNAMSNFWGLMIQGFTQAGQDPKGFISGMLSGTQKGLDKFLDRHADIVDAYSTGEEKRAREKMGIDDKRDQSLFDIQDKSQQYLANLADKQQQLKQNMKKESEKVGASAAYKQLAAELSINEKELARASIFNDIVNTSLTLRQAERTDTIATIGALKDWQDVINDTQGGDAAKAFTSNLTNLDKNIESAFDYTLGEGPDGSKIGMIGGQALKDDQARALARAKSDVKQKFLSLLKTGSHRDQQEAMEGALKYVTDKYTRGKGSGSGGAGGTQKPAVGAKATANGIEYTFDGEKFVDVNGNVYTP